MSSNELAHFGVKGMRWGHRKRQETNIQARLKGITVRADGSISVQKGASLQRLVSSDGSSLPLKGLTYASLTDHDNAKYVNFIGGKGFFGGGRDQVLQLTATKPIKAPSLDEATRVTSELFLTNPKFRETFTDMSGQPIPKKDLERIKKEPAGKTAKEWYTTVNTALTFDPGFDPTAPYVQKTVREKFESKGYNALRDENDFQAGVSKAPIIVFSPEKTLKVTKVSDITDELRGASKEKLKEYKKLGKNWVDTHLYE